MKTLTYETPININLLAEQILNAYPELRGTLVSSPRFGDYYKDPLLYIESDGVTTSVTIPDDFISANIDTLVLAHNPLELSFNETRLARVKAHIDFILDSFTTIGKTPAQINTYIDNNVTSLAQARDYLKLLTKIVFAIALKLKILE